MEDKPCHLCGSCCRWIKDGKIVKCHYLIKVGTKNICRVYKNRLGKLLDKELGIRCGYRVQAINDHKGCPNNTGKPLLEVENK